MSLKTIARYSASGSTDTFNVPFPYLDKSHVHVLVGGVEVPVSNLSWPTSATVEITTGNPAAGSVVVVQRQTPTGGLVSFAPGNLDTTDLNVAVTQARFIAEEALDLGYGAWITPEAGEGGTIIKGSTGSVPMWDAIGNLVQGPTGDAIAGAQANATSTALDRILAEAARDATLAAVPTVFSPTLADLTALDTTTKTAAFLTETGRTGQFLFKFGDYSAHIASDPLKGVFAKADGVSASVGAWERTDKVMLEPRMFGASSSASAATNTAAFLACRDVARFLGLAGFFVVAEEAPYELTAGTNLSDNSDLYDGLCIQSIGRSTLKMIGSGEGLKIVNTVASNEYRWNVENFTIEGGPTITNAFVLGNINHSTFRGIETRECLNAGIKTHNTVCNQWEQCSAGNGNFAAQTTTPAFGWLRDNDFASVYINCKGEGAVHNPFSVDFVPSDVNTTNDTITITGHRYQTGTPTYIETTNSGPAGTSAVKIMYVIVVDANTIKLAFSYSDALAGTAIDLTSGGVGTHTLHTMHTGVGYYNSDWSTDYNGAYEGMSCGANILDKGSSHIGFCGTDFEANTHHDIVYLGDENYFEKIQSISTTWFENILIVDGATNPTHIGGFSRRIHNPGNSYAKIIGVALSDNVALGITGTGKCWTYGCVLRAVGGAITAEVLDRMGATYIVSPSSSSSDSALRVDSGAGMLLNLRADGAAYIPPAYSQTTAGAANLFVGSDGLLARSTSALKYKLVDGPIEQSTVDKVMALRGFRYRAKDAPDGRSYIGMAADDAHAAGLNDLVFYGDDGEVEGLMYERIVPVLIQKIASLEDRIIALEGRLG